MDISMSILNACNRCKNTCLAVLRMKNVLEKYVNGMVDTVDKERAIGDSVERKKKNQRRQIKIE